jgi:hypothetical protein
LRRDLNDERVRLAREAVFVADLVIYVFMARLTGWGNLYGVRRVAFRSSENTGKPANRGVRAVLRGLARLRSKPILARQAAGSRLQEGGASEFQDRDGILEAENDGIPSRNRGCSGF